MKVLSSVMTDYPADRIEDIDLAAALAAAIEFDKRVPADVTIDVSNGVVTLEGQVDTARQRRIAEAVVRRFAVSSVINAIIVKSHHSV